MTRRSGTRRPRSRRLSVATRLAVSVIAVSAAAVAVTSMVGLLAGERAADRLLEQRLVSVRGAEQFELQAYFGGMRASVGRLATSPMAAEALGRFTAARDTIALPDAEQLTAEREALLDHYTDVVAPELARTVGRPVVPSTLLPGTDVGVHLQHAFLVSATRGDPTDVVEPVLDDVDGSTAGWAAVHQEFHPVYRDAVERLGVEDLYLIDLSGDVVYSVAKSPDFATSLRVGPHSGQALGASLRRATSLAAGEVLMVDMSVYIPALGRPVWFMVTPVVGDGFVRGALAVRVPVDPLDAIVSGGPNGPAGVGDTDEVYLAGADSRLRTDPRAFSESPVDYLEAAVEAGTMTGRAAELARGRSSTVLLQRADGDVVTAALAGGSGVERRIDHLGREALMAYTPLDVEGLEWALVTQITTDEAAVPVDDYRRLLLLIAAVLVSVVTFGAVAWAGVLLRPVRLVGERLRRSSTDLAHDPVSPVPPVAPVTGIDEFARLVDGFAAMEQGLAERRIAVEEAHGERRAVLRSLLPAAIVSRLDHDDRSAVEHPSSATVVVFVMRGSEPVAAAGVRECLEGVVSTIDEVSARYGVERVKLVGDSCFCAVGHQQLYLDHARRAVEFAHEVLAVNAAGGAGTDLAVGMSSGPVNVGLGGGSQMIYDVWGATVTEAYLLARQSASGAVSVSESTRERLPDGATVGEAVR